MPLQNALRVGMARGELRSDLDVEACFDAIAGVAYYQLVVRGDRVNDPAVVERMRAAIEVIWRGMGQLFVRSCANITRMPLGPRR